MTLDAVFSRLRQDGRKALIPYVTAGFPDRARFPAILQAVGDSGSDVIEVGVPFSDPIADGPTIQFSSHRALEDGVTLSWIFETLARHRPGIPVVLMSYYNPLLARGLKRFADDCRAHGVQGVVVPDLPFEEAHDLEAQLRPAGIDLVRMVAPTTPEGRLRQIATRARGFLYLVSVTGVTGSRNELPAGLEDLIRRVRAVSAAPVCVGFGISGPEAAARIGSAADGVILGSALVETIRRAGSDPAGEVRRFLGDVRRALDALPSREEKT